MRSHGPPVFCRGSFSAVRLPPNNRPYPGRNLPQPDDSCPPRNLQNGVSRILPNPQRKLPGTSPLTGRGSKVRLGRRTKRWGNPPHRRGPKWFCRPSPRKMTVPRGRTTRGGNKPRVPRFGQRRSLPEPVCFGRACFYWAGLPGRWGWPCGGWFLPRAGDAGLRPGRLSKATRHWGAWLPRWPQSLATAALCRFAVPRRWTARLPAGGGAPGWFCPSSSLSGGRRGSRKPCWPTSWPTCGIAIRSGWPCCGFPRRFGGGTRAFGSCSGVGAGGRSLPPTT